MDQLRMRMRRRLSRCSTPVLPSEGVRAVSRYRPIAPKPPHVPCVSESSSTITLQNTYVGADTHVPSLSPEHQSSKKGRKMRNKNSETHTPTLKRPNSLSPGSAREKREDLSGFRRGHAADNFAMLFQQDERFIERAAASAPSSFVLPVKTMQSDIFGSAGGTFDVVHHRNDVSGSCIILNTGTRLKHDASEIDFLKAPQPSRRFDEEEQGDEGKDHVRRKSVSLRLPPEAPILHAQPSTFLLGSLASSNTNQSCTNNVCGRRDIGCSEIIVPEARRPVRSTISVESISAISNAQVELKLLSSEQVQSKLEESDLPGLIADPWNVVRWVNAAYKAMVGQPDCPWLMSTVSSCSTTIAGAVLLSSNVDIPTSASSFSARVNVQWTKSSGQRRSMTLPCDVTAFEADHSRRMLAWRFDIHAGLGLTCPAAE